MTLWLDHFIFGNGHGLAMPHSDGRYYWLSGRLYTWIGGLGAQLQSMQWFHPIPGEERILSGNRYRPFHSIRQGLRVRVTWTTRLPDDLNAANARIREIETTLGRS